MLRLNIQTASLLANSTLETSMGLQRANKNDIEYQDHVGLRRFRLWTEASRTEHKYRILVINSLTSKKSIFFQNLQTPLSPFYINMKRCIELLQCRIPSTNPNRYTEKKGHLHRLRMYNQLSILVHSH